MNLPFDDLHLSLPLLLTQTETSAARGLTDQLCNPRYFIPDLFSALYEEVAVRYANFSNLIGFDDGSFDGAAWFAWYGRWGFYKFASLVYQNLDHPTAVHTSGVVVSTSWMECT